jgi:hypothetical protein
MDMRKLKRSELQVGIPLPWPLFDENRQMIVLPGFVPRDEAQRELVANLGFYRKTDGPVCQQSAREAVRARGAGTVPKEKDPTFAEIGFPVGSPFAIRPSEDSAHHKLPVKLVGWIEDETLLVTHPTAHDQLLFVKDGAVLHVRAGHDKYVCTFDTTVVKAQLQPFPMLMLRYPSQVNVSRVRGTTRIKTAIIASVSQKGCSIRHACTVRDLSLKGLLVNAKEAVAKTGDLIDIYFRVSFDGVRHDFELTGEVRSCGPCHETGKAGGWNHGIELDPIADAERRLLQLYIYSRQLEEA